MKKIKTKKGITLIALVITIIVILILAGVSIAFLAGDNGILSKAILAKSESQKSAAIEKLNLKIQNLIISKNGNAKLLDLNEFVDNSSSNYDNEITLVEEVQNLDTEAKIKMDGYIFTINNLLKISSINGETNQLPVNTASITQGTEVVLPDSWGTTSTRNISTDTGLELSSVKISSVYAVAVGDGITVPVPYGFYYVGGNLNTGVIISDNQADSYNSLNIDRSGYTYALSGTTNHLTGNQFVFIPCDTSSYIKTSWGASYQNGNYDTNTQDSELEQVKKYGGFYVARYEAGLAITIPEFNTAQYHNSSNQIYNLNGVPQSKAEQIPWNFVDWPHAKANTKLMYDNDYVYSGLITGTQWDVILNTMINKTGMTTANMTNSGTWGNYNNDSLTFSGTSSIYVASTAYQYPFGNTSVTGYNIYKTGESASTMKYGIADIAGNLWEWTEEASFYGGNIATQYKEIRGGSFSADSPTYSACYRAGNCTDAYSGPAAGFRAVLYMK